MNAEDSAEEAVPAAADANDLTTPLVSRYVRSRFMDEDYLP